MFLWFLFFATTTTSVTTPSFNHWSDEWLFFCFFIPNPSQVKPVNFLFSLNIFEECYHIDGIISDFSFDLYIIFCLYTGRKYLQITFFQGKNSCNFTLFQGKNSWIFTFFQGIFGWFFTLFQDFGAILHCRSADSSKICIFSVQISAISAFFQCKSAKEVLYLQKIDAIWKSYMNISNGN